MTATRSTTRTSPPAKVALAVAALFLVAGCAGFRSESDGATVGRNICKLKSADNQNQADRAMRKIQRNLDQAQRTTGVPVSQDLNAIQNQLDDLSKHATNGNSALAQQDIIKLQRNVAQAISTTTGNTQRYYQGLKEGLSNCDGS
jgi:hypothetical protein